MVFQNVVFVLYVYFHCVSCGNLISNEKLNALCVITQLGWNYGQWRHWRRRGGADRPGWHPPGGWHPNEI